ncbi:MAG TPA: hypothetical protein VMW38_15560 [Terriglobia bacterium]|nr:hypothetical protein [Terriglobia bacterium]
MDKGIENCRAAIEAIRLLLERQPYSGLAHYDLGTLYLKIDDYSGALEQHRILKVLNEDLAAKLLDQIFPALGKAKNSGTSEAR